MLGPLFNKIGIQNQVQCSNHYNNQTETDSQKAAVMNETNADPKKS